MSKQDGGPAFPREYEDCHSCGRVSLGANGMSLRDYFAAQTLASFSDALVLKAIKEEASARKRQPSELIAAFAYDVADAMLKAREAK